MPRGQEETELGDRSRVSVSGSGLRRHSRTGKSIRNPTQNCPARPRERVRGRGKQLFTDQGVKRSQIKYDDCYVFRKVKAKPEIFVTLNKK